MLRLFYRNQVNYQCLNSLSVQLQDPIRIVNFEDFQKTLYESPRKQKTFYKGGRHGRFKDSRFVGLSLQYIICYFTFRRGRVNPFFITKVDITRPPIRTHIVVRFPGMLVNIYVAFDLEEFLFFFFFYKKQLGIIGDQVPRVCKHTELGGGNK